jgi:hypothetical protein
VTRTKARQCAGKKRYGSKTDAVRGMWKAIARGAARSRLNVYQCPHCSVPQDAGWHVGHKLRSRGRRR